VVFHFFGVPADADAEQEAAVGDLIDRRHQLRGLDRVALVDQADAGADILSDTRPALAAVRVTRPPSVDVLRRLAKHDLTHRLVM
jgi:hypothetical protein